MEKETKPSFADIACDLRSRKIKNVFFKQMNTLIDWRPISNIINKHYEKGESAVGSPSYPGLLLFKMSLLQTWYGLSDYEIEDRLNDSISFSQFCKLPMDYVSPDHSTLSRFRTVLTKKGVYEKLFKQLNKQLEKNKIIVKSGAIVDASITDSPLKPKGKTNYEITEDRDETPRDEAERNKEDKAQKLLRIEQPGVDDEAKWIKKAGKLRYGYKKHKVTDEEGLVLGVVTTSANVNEITNLEEVLDAADLPEDIYLYGDKGYQSEKNQTLLKSKKLKDRILSKAKKGIPLTERQKLRNKLIGKTRFKIERTFGSIKRWFNSNYARYKGLAKTHTQHLLEAMAYNLYRSPGIIASNSLKTMK